ncbi:MAG: ATP-dependent Clp protease ATP-binding subunit [Oscillospiraceae bacterium]|nr:ATP-dependent Clp protease ATP-binding subunit [Oscillospiraceae bacterium]
MLCTRCGKRPAVVFITAMQNNQTKNEGLCMMCAKQSQIPQITEYIDKLGITDEDIEAMSNDIMGLMDEGVEKGDGYSFGDTDTIPPFLSNLFNDVFKPNGKEALLNGESEQQEKRKAKKIRPKEKEKEKTTEKTLKFVDSYCTNLSKKAAEGKLDRVIGRDREISRVIQILSRRTKNNPCLIGEPGVGKTAIAEGIAQHICEGTVPFNISDKRIYLLDMTALVAGTQYRGQFENRVKNLIQEVKEEGNIILFIDEVHTLVAAGDAEGAMNAANLFKPALSRGELQVIGATTFKEYRKYIEKDSALERRFQPVTVEEPTIDDTIGILRGIKGYYEEYHSVKMSDYLLKSCAILSERYINDRFLPDKAIDLLDESCAYCSIAHPEIGEYKKLQQNIETKQKLKADMENEAEPNYEAITIVTSEIVKCTNQLEELREKAENVQVDPADISKVIELWTGIPASKIEQSEFQKIGMLESALKQHIVGQDEAIKLLANAIKRSRVQLAKRRRPASFIFVGPTGVGKTELVKALSQELFDSTDPLIRLDMSEFMEKHAVSRIIGSPPGYVGYDEAGQLTEKVRRKPYSVVLFDEIEKAHPDVMNILLQILDEGKINDAQGRTVSFENTVIAMTSNAGSADKSSGMGFAKTDSDITKERAIKALREFLRPEFISRIDEIVVFKPLSRDNYKEIAALMLDEMREPLGEKDVTLIYTDIALALIADKAYNKKYGARDIRRVIRSEVEDKIADIIIEKSGYMNELLISANDKDILVEAK